MNKYVVLFLTGLLIWSCRTNNSSQIAELTNFPKKSQPQEIGNRIANKFLQTPHTHFGNPYAEKSLITLPIPMHVPG